MLSDAELEGLYGRLLDAVRRADRPLALTLATQAEAEGLEEPLVLVLAAEAREAEGDPGAAIPLLRRAVELAPADGESWRRLSTALSRSGDRAGAATAADRALALAPDLYANRIAAGAARFALGELDVAQGHYDRARALAPGGSEGLEGLAAIAARRGDHRSATTLAEAALVESPGAVSARLTLARSALDRGDSEDAERRTTDLLDQADLIPEQRIAALDLRADARDALGRPHDAFADYRDRNALIAIINPMPAGMETRLDQARRLRRELDAVPAHRWLTRPTEDLEGQMTASGHVFLLGFPRSGTTLLEKMLAGHPGAVTLEEVDCVSRAAGDLLIVPEGLERLLGLSAVELKRRRAAYWSGARENLGDRLQGRVLVDKLPLHTLALPAIARLFPGARILFAVRDPRDVVLSCFRRRFVMNAAMREFLTLEGAADYYDAVMRLAEASRAALPLTMTDARHEVLLDDFDDDAARLLAFIGLEWNPAVRDFADRARQRPRTPSDLQLLGGLSRRGLGQWRRYAEWLSPVLPVLAPWVERWGYPPD